MHDMPMSTAKISTHSMKTQPTPDRKQPSPRPVVYQFIPPDNPAAVVQKPKQDIKQKLKYKSTECLDSLRTRSDPQPETKISRPVSSHLKKQLEAIREDLNRNARPKFDLGSPADSSKRESVPLFKKNSSSGVNQKQPPCRKSNSSVSNMNSSSGKQPSSSGLRTIEEQAAAYGIRNGVLSRLGNYHPQWMSTSALSQVEGALTKSQLINEFQKPVDNRNHYMGK
jgi:hypothetical protein